MALLGLALVSAAVSGLGTAEKRDYTDPDQLAALVSQKGEPYVLVDVRTPEEYGSGHIPTALNIPNTEISARPPSANRSALIIVYCRSGSRSAAAKKALEAMGFTRVVDFGAVTRWKGDLVLGDKPVGQ
jgi:phage shock protein E